MPRASRPTFTSDAREEAYENLLFLVRSHIITSAEFQNEKAKLVRREARSQQLAEQKRQAKRQKALAKRQAKAQAKAQEYQQKRFLSNVSNDLKKKKTMSYPIGEIDTKIGFKKFIEMITASGRNLTMKIGNITWVINDLTKNKLLRLIEDEISEKEIYEDSWGALVVVYKKLGGLVTISEWKNTNKNKKEKGAFFRYYHNTSLDLKRYGIYNKTDKQDYTETCLIQALANAGLPSSKQEQLKHIVKNRIIPKCLLNKVCEIIEAQIILKQNDLQNKHLKTVYGKQYEKVYHIGLIEDHYIIVEPTTLSTRFALENYNDVKDIKNWNSIYRKSDGIYKRTQDRFLDSYDIVRVLLENKDTLLTEMSYEDINIASTQFYDKVADEITNLEYDVKLCKPVENTKPKKDAKVVFENVVFDFECGFNKMEDDCLEHIPYVVSIKNDKLNKTFYGKDCGLQMLSYLSSVYKNIRLIAHNATYDFRFLLPYLRGIEKLARGNRLISLKGIFGSCEKPMNIQIKDSFHLISMALSKFPKVFNLPDTKEIMPYSLYTVENIEKRFINIEYVVKNFIKEKDQKHFLENIQKWNLQKGEEYDIIDYSARYCEIDCKLLWSGYNIFRQWMLDCVDIDIDEKLTIASLSHTYLINQGCYEGVYELTGSPQLFIQKSVVGGRTMVAKNEMVCVDEVLNDFDAVSLYPSAMSRMDGFLKGLPKIIENTDYNWVKQQDGYFVEIVIKSVGIHRDFPLMSYKTEEGIRNFSNDMIGRTMIVDKVTLEDLIQFQNVTFDIIRGYYFNEGFNTKINEVMKYLFQERLNKKKEGNPAQEVYKLIMNSGYGKSIMKAVETESNIFDDEDAYKVYVSRNYNSITTITQFGTKFEVKSMKPLIEHSNIAQVGSSILAWSKRLMNEVMCLAEDEGLKLYYQDTDSIHIKDCDIQKLETAFKQKYNRDLIGKQLGQFHSDFEIKGCEEIVSRRAIFLGKKSYIDELVGKDKDGNEKVEYHTRMKGIPNSCLEFAVKKMGLTSMFELYQNLFNGIQIKVDLTNSGEKANFKFMPDYQCKTLSIFERTLSFGKHL